MTIKLPRQLNFVLALVFLFSCGKALPELHGVDVVRWQSDPNGCAGVRLQMIGSLQTEKKKLLGLSEMDIVEMLGKPDQQELYKRNQKFYRYLVEPGKMCNTALENPKKLVVRFNAVGLAKEITVE
jgi:predicted  nucleic acid-binding Zn ribbon protein